MSKRTVGLLAAVVLVSVAIEMILLGDSDHHGGAWNHIPSFDFFFGFAACWIIVVGSKALGHRWLQKPEGYYEASDRAEGQASVSAEHETEAHS